MKTEAKVHYNSNCSKCGVTESQMVRLGPMIFCNKCYEEEFGLEYDIDTSSEIYKKWITEYKNKWIV
jgi:hypothetical protein